jgi:drug/metabolite transporter (DMT)-like permease
MTTPTMSSTSQGYPGAVWSLHRAGWLSDFAAMIAILGGLGAALSWAIATVSSTRSSRALGAFSVIAWVMTIGFLVTLGPALLAPPANVEPLQVVGLVIAGVSYNLGLLLTYAALTIGRISIVTPIVATEGAIAAILSVILGESLNVATAIVLAAIALGVILAAVERSADEGQRTDSRHARRAVLLAIGSAASFSIGLVLAGRLGASLPVAWVVLVPRGVGVLGIAIPMALLGRLRLQRAIVPFVVVSGVLEAFGTGLYIVAAQSGVATAAVLGSQFAAFAAIAAFLFFGERLARIQIVGVGLIIVGVSALAAVRA